MKEARKTGAPARLVRVRRHSSVEYARLLPAADALVRAIGDAESKDGACVRCVLQLDRPSILQDARAARTIAKNPRLLLDCPISTTLNPVAAGEDAEREMTLFSAMIPGEGVKQEALVGLTRKLLATTHNRSLVEDARLAADELVSNALAAGAKAAALTIGWRGDRLAVACADDVGKLDVDAFLSHVAACCRFEAEGQGHRRIEAGSGGHSLMELGQTLFLACKAGRKATVGVILQMKLGARERAAISKNVYKARVP